ncbi:MAG: serine/threonine-protein kinase, partial [Gemmatimonadota bacterium]
MPQPEPRHPAGVTRRTSAESGPADPARPTGRGTPPGELLDQLGRELGPDLKVLRHIGDESFGSLFLAHESALRRDVVIKVLRRDYVDNAEVRRRFEREARAAAHISHPNVVPVFRVGTLESGVPFFIEPYVGDCTLKQKLKSVGRFQPSEVREILHQVAAGLDAAHRTGIVHRDVRPETVRCEGDSRRLLLTDFGIAGILESGGLEEDTITYPGEVLGSPGYMSPEQREGAPATDRSDIY